jgi:MoxR-like ATPase
MIGTSTGGSALDRPSQMTPGGGGQEGDGRSPAIDPHRAARQFAALTGAVNSVLRSQEENVRLAVGSFVAHGHLLVEDLPGMGKTTLAKALAASFGLSFRRVQCTADLLPADITGAMVFDRQQGVPVFRPGPIFTNVLMADELNRASARTQSALLESMEERQVTVDGHSEPLPSPFMVVATQNPHDAAGTSPLPHGQRDRFLIRLSLGYPDRRAEESLLAGDDPAETVGSLAPALAPSDLTELMQAAESVRSSAAARAYMLDIIEATRSHPSVRVGASPRASRALLRMARAMALASGRHFVVPDDIREVAIPVLAHRLILDAPSQLTGTDAEHVVGEILDATPVPLGDSNR